MTENHTLTPLALEDSTSFLIDAEAQIQHLLMRLAKRPELVCLYPQKKRDPFALSALLQVADDHAIFDISPDEHINKALASAPALVCVSNLDRVHIQFEASRPALIEYDGRRALRTARPDKLLFIQRRDYFRLGIPSRQPVTCHIPQEHGDSYLSVDIIDISIGGISFSGPLPFMALVPGMKLRGCRLTLPEIGNLEVDLLVCCSRENRLHAGTRIGCRFMHLSGGDETLIQRYINRIERHRIACE